MKIMKDHLNAAGLRVEGRTNDWVTTTCSRIDGWVDWWMHVGSNLRRTVEIYRLNSENTVTVNICVGLFSFRLLHLFFSFRPFFLISLFILILSIWHRSHLCYQSFLIFIYPRSLWFHCFIEISCWLDPRRLSLPQSRRGLNSLFAPVRSLLCVFLSPARMRASFVVSSFLVASALKKSIHHHNAGKNVIVWKIVTVYATNIASGSIPSVTVSEAIESAKFVTIAKLLLFRGSQQCPNSKPKLQTPDMPVTASSGLEWLNI